MIFENVFKKTHTFLTLPSPSYLPIASSPLCSTISLPMAQHKPVNLQAQAHSTNSHRNFPRIFKTQRLQKIILFRQHHFSTCVIYIIIVAIIFMNSTISGHWYLRDDWGGGGGRFPLCIKDPLLLCQWHNTRQQIYRHRHTQQTWLNWSQSQDISKYQTLRKTILYCWHKHNHFYHNMVAQLCNWTVWVDLAAWLSGIQQTPFICSSSGWETTSSRLLSFLLAPWLDSSLVLWSDARTRKESPADQIQMLFRVARTARIASTPLVETEPHAWNWNWARGVVPRLCRQPLPCAAN